MTSGRRFRAGLRSAYRQCRVRRSQAERLQGRARERELHFTEELSRRVRDYEEARKFAAQLAEQQRQREQTVTEQRANTAGPEPPTRAR